MSDNPNKQLAIGHPIAEPNSAVHSLNKEVLTMTSKPTLHVASSNEVPDPFSPENLRLDQSFTEQVAVKKLLTTVPVRKPNKQDFVRVHPDPSYSANFPMIVLKEENEEYIVQKDLVPELLDEIVSQTLTLTINRQGVVSLWPTRLPDADGKDNDYWRSAREAKERATKAWIRVRANKSLGAYDISEALGNFGEPEWPKLSLWDILRIAFRDHLITSIDHPIVKRLRGLA
jgi:hypothetical protein